MLIDFYFSWFPVCEIFSPSGIYVVNYLFQIIYYLFNFFVCMHAISYLVSCMNMVLFLLFMTTFSRYQNGWKLESEIGDLEWSCIFHNLIYMITKRCHALHGLLPRFPLNPKKTVGISLSRSILQMIFYMYIYDRFLKIFYKFFLIFILEFIFLICSKWLFLSSFTLYR